MFRPNWWGPRHYRAPDRDAAFTPLLTRLSPLEVQPGSRFSGRIVLADDESVPPETRVLLSRENTWDSRTATVGRDGGFSFAGVPAERDLGRFRREDYEEFRRRQDSPLQGISPAR